MTDQDVLRAIEGAADAAGTVGATARMASDFAELDHAEVIVTLRRLEHAGEVDGEGSPSGSRWYTTRAQELAFQAGAERML